MTTTRKSKIVAVLLAIVSGCCTWIYTYRKDGSKFWASMVILLVTLAYSVLRSLKASIERGEVNSIGSYSPFLLAVALIWLTAIVLAIIRPSRWYKDY